MLGGVIGWVDAKTDTFLLSEDNTWVPGPAMGSGAYGGVCSVHIEGSDNFGGDEVTVMLAFKGFGLSLKVGVWSCREKCDTWTSHGMHLPVLYLMFQSKLH